MTIDKKLVKQHFGKMAHNYDQYTVVQKTMAHELLQRVKQQGQFTKILEIGCGTGYFTRLLAKLYSNAHITATDISEGMLAVAKNNLSDCTNISFAVEDGENLKTTEQYDLIISNAAFQWFNNHQQSFKKLYEHLLPGGCLLYSTFGNSTFRELTASFEYAHQLLSLHNSYRHGPDFLSITDLQTITTNVGFISSYHEKYCQEYFPTVKNFLYSIKKIGANNAASSKHTIINKKLMLTMIRYYEQNYKLDTGIYATYHIIYGTELKSTCT